MSDKKEEFFMGLFVDVVSIVGVLLALIVLIRVNELNKLPNSLRWIIIMMCLTVLIYNIDFKAIYNGFTSGLGI